MRFWRQRKKPGPNGHHGTGPFEDPRWNLPHPLAILRVDVRSERRTLLGYAEYISPEGMMIGTVWPKEVGSRHRVEFALPAPADTVVRCNCEVVWARPYSVDRQRPGMGLEFVAPPESVAESIESLWRAGHAPDAPPTRTWSEFDRKWIDWTPRIAAPKGFSS